MEEIEPHIIKRIEDYVSDYANELKAILTVFCSKRCPNLIFCVQNTPKWDCILLEWDCILGLHFVKLRPKMSNYD